MTEKENLKQENNNQENKDNLKDNNNNNNKKNENENEKDNNKKNENENEKDNNKKQENNNQENKDNNNNNNKKNENENEKDNNKKQENKNSIDEEILQNYLNQFNYLKEDLQKLLEKKNPIGFIIGVEKIFGKINIYLKEISIFLNNSFENFNLQDRTNVNSFLYDIGFLNFYQNITKDYIKKVKYFDPEKYFEIYSKFDPNFKHFIQKIISKIDIDKGTFKLKEIDKGNFKLKEIEKILKEDYFKKYKNCLNIIKSIFKNYEKNKGEYKNYLYDNNNKNGLKINSGYSDESSFCNNIVSFYFKNEEDKNKREEFLYNLFEIFDINKYINNKDLKYSKLKDIVNIIGFNETNEYKIKQIKEDNKKEIDKIVEIINNYEFNFKNYIRVSEIIEKVEKGQERGYLWGYFKYNIKKNFFNNDLVNNIVNNVVYYYTNKILSKEEWLNLKIDYKRNLENISDNSNSKQQSLEFLNILNFYKKLIIKLEENTFSDIIKIHILRYLYYNLSVKKENLEYIKFIMYFTLCDTYYEYKQVCTFFKEYQVYENNDKKAIIKISYLNIILLVSFIILSGYFFSIFFSIGTIFLVIGYLRTCKENCNNIRLHLGLKLFGKIMIYVSTIFFLLTNNIISFDLKLNKENITQIVKKHDIDKIITYTGKDFIDNHPKLISETKYIITNILR